MQRMGIDDLRKNIEVLQREIADVCSAFVTDEEIEQRAKQFVEDQIRLVETEIFGNMSDLYKVKTSFGGGSWPGLFFGTRKRPELSFALSIYLNKESFLRLTIERAKKQAAIGGRRREENDRQEKIDTIKRQLLQLEVEEEAEIERLQLLGEDVMRRVNADPRAILGFTDDEPAAPANV